MSTPKNASPYFKVSNNLLTIYQKEQFAETCRLFGYDLKYIPIEFLEADFNWVFGEINKVKYTKAFDIRMFVEGYDELHKAMLNYSKFGILIIPDLLSISVGDKDFYSIVRDDDGTIVYPKVGDLIYFEIHDESIIFEITSVSHKFDSFYKFSVKLYNYDALTTIQTGVQKIDDLSTVDADDPTSNQESNDLIEETAREIKDPTRRSNIWGDL